MKKIFVIGFNKTGTSSIHHLFLSRGIRSVHTVENVLNIIDQYEAFTDGDHFHFDQYYEKYPESVFILNTRPLKNWLISRYKHAKFHQFQPCWCWPVSIQKTNQWIEYRDLHYSRIFSFFQDKPSQLFIVNIERDGWENALLTFLNMSTTNVVKTCINVRHEQNIHPPFIMQIKKNVDQCLRKKQYSGNEVITKDSSALTLYANYL